MTLEPLNQEARERLQKALEYSGYVTDLQTPEELHYFAAEYNWDNGTIESLRWIIRQPFCDKGTALLLYWSADPKSLYSRYANREQVEEYYLDQYDFLKELEDRILEDRYSLQNFCYPTLASHKQIRLEQYRNSGYKKQLIPEIMFDLNPAEVSYAEQDYDCE
jgi:hypothetical protein